ncbi:MAG: CDP-6-deoxy-D-xylo-4-hexulose-3-dehydrase [Candidatus Azotimanducaceae bacterium]|jgi:CDP-6-deoxy-D-xylo-4-hexulose-3-dehydrase
MSRSTEKEQDIYKRVEEYFSEITREEMIPSHFKVPIGGGYYGSDEVNAAIKCYLHGFLSTQKPVIDFENAFSKHMGVAHSIAVNSGTSANILALNALKEVGHLKPGDEVALPATTFISVASPILQLGLVPVYIDIDQETLNIDVQELAKALEEKDHKIKCVMVVHTLGMPAPMEEIMVLAKEYTIKVIEDCCESHGAELHGKKVGSFGDIATWSFYVAHNMTSAEGGMVATNSDEYQKVIRDLREFGRDRTYSGERYGYTQDNLVDFDERYTFHRIGWNFRMADAPAAFGHVQLNKLDETNAIRTKSAKYLHAGLKKHKNVLILPKLSDDTFSHVYYTFPMVIKDGVKFPRKEFAQFLESESVETRAIMCGTLPDQPSLAHAPGRSVGDLSNSRYVRDHSFFIGCHPLLGTEELDYAIEKISEYITSKS